MSKRALITGITGQDGGYLAKAFLDRGDTVIGHLRPGRTLAGTCAEALGVADRIQLTDAPRDTVAAARDLLQATVPDYVANLAAESSVPASFTHPVETAHINAMDPLCLLEAIRLEGGVRVRFLQASSGEVFGPNGGACTEDNPLDPITPYAVAKAFTHRMVGIYRDVHGLFAGAAILFAHESPYRTETFLTRKVTRAFAQIRHGELDVLELGALSAARDWGFAGDYAEGMRLMLEAPVGRDYVLASGQAHSVREFVSAAAAWFGYDLEWRGQGLDEQGVDRANGKVLVRVNPAFFRQADTPKFLGVPARAEAELGWRRAVDFQGLVAMMCAADDAAARARR